MNRWAEVMAWMEERCEVCGCLLNNAPECEGGCSHRGGCPPGPLYGWPPGEGPADGD